MLLLSSTTIFADEQSLYDTDIRELCLIVKVAFYCQNLSTP